MCSISEAKAQREMLEELQKRKAVQYEPFGKLFLGLFTPP